MALNYGTIVDADGHILEPPDLWERYIDPEFRHVAPKGRPDFADEPAHAIYVWLIVHRSSENQRRRPDRVTGTD